MEPEAAETAPEPVPPTDRMLHSLPPPEDRAWELLGDGSQRVRCLACAHHCVILPGKTGVCGVRRNEQGQLVLMVYGRPISIHTDPIEKKPLYHFLPGSQVLSLGTVGCNFACPWCQNWQISQVTRKVAGHSPQVDLEDIGYEMSPQELVQACERKGLKCIAFTYNEPTIFLEYALDTMKLARAKGIASVFVTNGYESRETMELMKPYLNAMNIDLKAFKEETYLRLCKARLQPVLDTIRLAHEMGIWVEVTTLIVPGVNDSEDEIRALSRFVRSVSADMPLHFSAFHPDFEMPDTPRTSPRVVMRAQQIAQEEGLRFVYVGNIAESTHTRCPSCSRVIVQREGHFRSNVTGLRLLPPSPTEPFPQAACRHCGAHPIPGIWFPAQLQSVLQAATQAQQAEWRARGRAPPPEPETPFGTMQKEPQPAIEMRIDDGSGLV